MTSFALLAEAEAVLRVDFLSRVAQRRKDDVSRAFRALYQEKGDRVDLDRELLEIWRTFVPACRGCVGEFRGALKLRNWFAHGRYWTPRLGRMYEARTAFDLAGRMFAVLPGVAGWG
jgi:hypothetical protein